MELVLVSKNEIETIKIASLLAKKLLPHDVVTLTGDLGAGKTTFVKGIAKEFGVTEDVISPTFNILKCYFSSEPNLYHIDAYRLENVHQDLGLEEFIDGDGVCVVEWPMYISSLIPIDHLEVRIENLGGNIRKLTFVSTSSHFDSGLSFLKGERI